MERLNFDILDENHDVTALEMLSTQIGGEWSASRAKENYWTLLESEFDSGSIYVAFIWHPGFDSMIATISWRQMHKTIIFCLNFSRQLQRNHEQTCTQNRPKHLRVDSKLARLGLRRRRSVLLNTFLTLRILFTIYPFAFSSATVVVF